MYCRGLLLGDGDEMIPTRAFKWFVLIAVYPLGGSFFGDNLH